MKYIVLFFFITLSATAQTNLSHSIHEPLLKKDSVVKEFALLYNLLNTIHPGQFMHCDKASFDQCFDSLSKSIHTDLSLAAYYLKTAFLLAKLKDGHTQINDSEIKQQLQHSIVFPFSLCKINNQFIIRKAGIPDYTNYVGTSITKINGKNIQEVVAKLSHYMSIEGKNETALNSFLRSFPFYYFFTDTSKTFTVTFCDSLGHCDEKIIQGVEYSLFQKNTHTIVEPVQHEFYRNNLAVLTVNTFGMEDFNVSHIDYKNNIDSFFSRIAELKITNIIIDVRNNNGGAAEVANYLFSYLTNKPYYYFEYVGKKYKKAGDWKKYATNPAAFDELDKTATLQLNNLFCQTEKSKPTQWWFKQQKGRKNYFKGNIVTLIGGGSYSTTGHFIALIKNNRVGKLMGECSHGSYYSNDGGQQFQLPYSKLQVKIPTVQFKMRMPDFKYDAKGICPDKEITPLPEDFIIDYDRVLNAAKKQITAAGYH